MSERRRRKKPLSTTIRPTGDSCAKTVLPGTKIIRSRSAIRQRRDAAIYLLRKMCIHSFPCLLPTSFLSRDDEWLKHSRGLFCVPPPYPLSRKRALSKVEHPRAGMCSRYPRSNESLSLFSFLRYFIYLI